MKVVILGTAHLESTPGKCSPDGKFIQTVNLENINIVEK